MKTGRCARCAALVGADNQCERCHAFMPVVERTGGYVCGACESPRERNTSTACASDAALLQALEQRQERPLWLYGILTGGPLLGLAGFSATRGFVLLAQAAAAVAVILAMMLMLLLRVQRRLGARRRKFEIEQRIIGLAYQNDGLLREGDVSARLRISVVEARDVLGELEVQQRATVHSQRGPIEYRFGEARRTRAIRKPLESNGAGPRSRKPQSS
jgi:hypothetical protein